MKDFMKKLQLIPLVAVLLFPAPVLAQTDGETVFIVQQYRYDPGDTGGNRELGLSLCGTRCNALSGNFASYLKPGGWRLIRTKSNQEITLALDSPLLTGQCICVGEQYRVKWYDPAIAGRNP